MPQTEAVYPQYTTDEYSSYCCSTITVDILWHL